MKNKNLSMAANAVWTVAGRAFVAGALAITLGCQSQQRPSRRTALRDPSDVLVSTQWLAERLLKPGVVVVHVAASRTEYDRGHIPGAGLLLHREIAVSRGGLVNEFPPPEVLIAAVRRLGAGEASHIVIYDDDEGIWAARAFVALDYLGLGDKTALLDGQLKAWRSEGRPLSNQPTQPASSSFVPKLQHEVIVDLNAMETIVWAQGDIPKARLAIADARPPDQYAGLEPGEAIHRPGHIPGAVNLLWKDAIESEKNPRLLAVRDLRRMFNRAGIRPDDLVITYCRTGVQGSFLYFVALYLGYKVRLYDGSYIEWSAMDDLPVEGPSSGEGGPSR